MAPARRGRKESTGFGSLVLLASMIVLVGASAALIPLSARFVHGQGHAQRPLVVLVAVLVGAGIAYVAAVRQLGRARPTPLGVAATIGFALALGAIQLATDPIQEVDFYRYLVDGGVVACGENPYDLSPTDRRTALATIAAMSGYRADSADRDRPCLSGDPRWKTVLARTSYPELRTVYPPVMQAWFGAVVRAAGPSITGLRVSFLAAELLLLVLLAALLARVGANPLYVAVFGWAPLVFKETFNSAHADIIPALVLTAAALALLGRRHATSALLLGLCVAAKLFALALLPLWLRVIPAERRLLAVLAFVAGAVLPWLPFAGAGAGLFEGTWAFASQWTVNAPVFTVLVDLAKGAGLAPGPARALVAGVLALVILAIGAAVRLEPRKDAEVLALRAALLILVVLLVGGPAANPWYFCWLLPLVALAPRPAYLALVVMLPLYYLDFHLIYHEMTAYRPWLVAVEFAPFALLALLEPIYRNRSSSRGRMRSAAQA